MLYLFIVEGFNVKIKISLNAKVWYKLRYENDQSEKIKRDVQ